MSEEPITRACFQPWQVARIAADGQVYPCCVVSEELVIGNLNYENLNDILSGDRAVMLKRRLLSGDIRGSCCERCPNGRLVAPAEFKSLLEKRFEVPLSRMRAKSKALVEK